MKPKKIQPEKTDSKSRPIREKAYQYLKELILSGKLSSGKKLNQEFIAKQLRISRTPIREALHRLHSEGLIDLSDAGGFRVAHLSPEELEELFDIRSALEGYLMRSICRNMTEAAFDQLSDLIEKSQQALEADNVDEIFKRNTEFHETLYRLAEQKRMTGNIIFNMKEHMLRYRRDTLYHADAALRSIEAHRKILLALKLKDPNLCEYLMKRHIFESKVDAMRITFGKEPVPAEEAPEFSP